LGVPCSFILASAGTRSPPSRRARAGSAPRRRAFRRRRTCWASAPSGRPRTAGRPARASPSGRAATPMR